MTREIKFRGIRIDNGKWIYGYLFKDGWNCPFILEPFYSSLSKPMKVIAESVGQYTGIEDEEGTDICEGDIILHGAYQDDIDLVKYTKGYFYTMNSGYLVSECVNIRVIGNIYEHPHLLEDKA